MTRAVSVFADYYVRKDKLGNGGERWEGREAARERRREWKKG